MREVFHSANGEVGRGRGRCLFMLSVKSKGPLIWGHGVESAGRTPTAYADSGAG